MNEAYSNSNQFGGQLLRFGSQTSADTQSQRMSAMSNSGMSTSAMSNSSWGTEHTEIVPREPWQHVSSPAPVEVLHHHIHYNGNPHSYRSIHPMQESYDRARSPLRSPQIESLSRGTSISRSRSPGRPPSRLSDRPLLNQQRSREQTVHEDSPLETNRAAPKPPKLVKTSIRNGTWTPPLPSAATPTGEDAKAKSNVKKKSSRMFSMLGRKDRSSTVPVH